MICIKQIWIYLVCALTLTSAPLWGKTELPVLPATIAVQGLSLHINPQQSVYDANTGFSGAGTMFFPALGRELPVVYTNVRLDGQAHWQSGNVKATIAPDLLKAAAIDDLEHPKFVDNFDGLKNFIKAARSNLDELPLMLNTLPSYQNANFGTLAVMLTEINVSKDRTTASMMALERMPEGIYLPFTRTGVVFDPLSMQPFKEMQLDLTATADITDVQMPITFKAGDATGSTGTYVTFDCNGLKVFHVEGFHTFTSGIITPSPASAPSVTAVFSADVKSLRQFVIKVTIPKFTIAGVEDVVFEINDATIDYSDAENPVTFPEAYFTEMGNTAPTKKETWKGIHIGNVAISLPTLPMKDKDDKPFAFPAKDLIYDKGNGFSATFYIKTAGMADINVKGFQFSLDEFNFRVKKNSVQDLNFLGGMAIPVLKDDKGALKYKATFNTSGDATQAKFQFAVQFPEDIVLEVPFLELAQCKLQKTSVLKMQYKNSKWLVYANLHGAFDIGTKSPKLSMGLPFEGWKIGDNPSLSKQSGAEELPMSFRAFDLNGGSDAAPAKKMSGFPLTIDNISFGSEKGVYKLGMDIGVALGSGKSTFEAKGGIVISSTLNFAKLISKKPWEGIEFKDVSLDQLLVDANMSAFSFQGQLDFLKDDPIYGNGFAAQDLKFTVKGGKGFSLTANAIFGNKDDYSYFYVDADIELNPGLPFVAPLSLNKFGGGVYFNMKQTLSENGRAKYVPTKNIMGFKARVGVGLQKRETFDAVGELVFEFGGDWELRFFKIDLKAGLINDLASVVPSSDQPYRNSKVVGRCTMTYDNMNKTITASMSVALQNMSIQGSGSLNMFFNLKDASDWYVQLGTPQQPVRVSWGPASIGMYLMLGKGIGTLPDVATIVPELGGLGISTKRLEPSKKNESNTGSGFAFGLNYSIRAEFKALIFRTGFKAAFGIDALLRNNACPGTGWNGWVMEAQAYAYLAAWVDIKVNLLFVKGTFNIARMQVGAVLQASLPSPLFLRGRLAGRYSILGGLVSGGFSIGFKYEQEGKACFKTDGPVSPAVGQPIISATYPESGDEMQVFDDLVVTTNFKIRGVQSYEFSALEGEVYPNTYYYTCRIEQVDVMQGNKKLATITDAIIKDDYTLVLTPKVALPEKTTLRLVILVAAYDTDKQGGRIKGEAAGTETRTVSFRTAPRPEKVYTPMVAYSAPGTDQKYWYKGYARPKVTLKQTGYEYLFDPNYKGVPSEYKWNLYKKQGADSVLVGTYDISSAFEGEEATKKFGPNIEQCGYSVRYEYRYTTSNNHVYSERVAVYIPKTCWYSETGPNRSFVFDELNKLDLDKQATYRIEVIRRPKDFQQKTTVTADESSKTTSESSKNDGDDDDESEVSFKTRGLSVVKGSAQEIATLYTNVFSISQFTDLGDKIVLSQTYQTETVKGLGPKVVDYPFELQSYEGKRPYLTIAGGIEPFDKYDQIRVEANSTVSQSTGWDIRQFLYKKVSSFQNAFVYSNNSPGSISMPSYTAKNQQDTTDIVIIDHPYFTKQQGTIVNLYVQKRGRVFIDMMKGDKANFLRPVAKNNLELVVNSINEQNALYQGFYSLAHNLYQPSYKCDKNGKNCKYTHKSHYADFLRGYTPKGTFDVNGILHYTTSSTPPEYFNQPITNAGITKEIKYSFKYPYLFEQKKQSNLFGTGDSTM